MDSGLARHRVSMGMAGSDGMLGTAIFRFWPPNCSHVPSRPRSTGAWDPQPGKWIRALPGIRFPWAWPPPVLPVLAANPPTLATA